MQSREPTKQGNLIIPDGAMLNRRTDKKMKGTQKSKHNRIEMQKIEGDVFQGPVSLTDFRQETHGSCYLLSVLMAIATKLPLEILNCISDLDDGTVVVRFFDDKKQPVYYQIDKTDFHKNMSIHSGAPYFGLILKAYGFYMRDLYAKDKDPRAEQHILDMTGGGAAAQVFRRFGFSTAVTELDKVSTAMNSAAKMVLDNAFEADDMIVVGTRSTFDKEDRKIHAITEGHYFALVDYSTHINKQQSTPTSYFTAVNPHRDYSSTTIGFEKIRKGKHTIRTHARMANKVMGHAIPTQGATSVNPPSDCTGFNEIPENKLSNLFDIIVTAKTDQHLLLLNQLYSIITSAIQYNKNNQLNIHDDYLNELLEILLDPNTTDARTKLRTLTLVFDRLGFALNLRDFNPILSALFLTLTFTEEGETMRDIDHPAFSEDVKKLALDIQKYNIQSKDERMAWEDTIAMQLEDRFDQENKVKPKKNPPPTQPEIEIEITSMSKSDDTGQSPSKMQSINHHTPTSDADEFTILLEHKIASLHKAYAATHHAQDKRDLASFIALFNVLHIHTTASTYNPHEKAIVNELVGTATRCVNIDNHKRIIIDADEFDELKTKTMQLNNDKAYATFRQHRYHGKTLVEIALEIIRTLVFASPCRDNPLATARYSLFGSKFSVAKAMSGIQNKAETCAQSAPTAARLLNIQ